MPSCACSIRQRNSASSQTDIDTSASTVYTSPTTPCPFFFFFKDTAPTEIYTLSLHAALPIYAGYAVADAGALGGRRLEVHHVELAVVRSEEHTSELQSRRDLVCRLLL